MSLEAVSPSVSPECWLTAFGGPFSTGALHAFAALVRPCPEERLRPYAQPLFAILFQYAGAAADTVRKYFHTLLLEGRSTIVRSLYNLLVVNYKFCAGGVLRVLLML